MKHFFTLFFVFSLLHLSVSAQIGGNNTYEFLNLNSSARVTALGGNQIAVKDDDIFLGIENPALLNTEMSSDMAFSYVSYLADINYGVVAYAHNFKKIGTFDLGVKYIDYGQFTEYNQAGVNIGQFTAGEYAFFLGYARQLDSNFSIGTNIKTIYSSFYDQSSLGLVADIGFTYLIPKSGLTFSLLSKNMGSQLSEYNKSIEKEKIPFEIQFGMSKRLKNVPIRFGIILQQLQQWDLTYVNPNIEKPTSILGAEFQEKKKENGFLENFGRHLIFNAEFLLTKNFNFRFGYNYLRRSELKIDEKLGTVGISWGLGMRISKFHLSYARAAYHQAGATNTFSISTQLSNFIN